MKKQGDRPMNAADVIGTETSHEVLETGEGWVAVRDKP